MTASPAGIGELLTIRDWLRYAVSRFNGAGLVYGHGTERAEDEAAFLILSSLHLDVSELDPWLDARLTIEERQRLATLIESRISTRKPAPYLLGCAYVRGRRFRSDERAIVPRSYIAELLCDRMEEGEEDFPPFAIERPIDRILDLCTGGGSLAILAAEAFPDATVDAVDISAAALGLAAENVAAFSLEARIRLLEGNLFEPVAGQSYDLILCNPPYVTDAAVDNFPPEYKSEPELAHRAGADGLDIVRRVLDEAGRHLAPGGQIVIEIGQASDVLRSAYPNLPFTWLETATSSDEVVALPARALQPNPKADPRSRPNRNRD